MSKTCGLITVLKGDPDYRTKLEKAYADHLGLLFGMGQIHEWRYEPISLRIARVSGHGAWYKPDFAVVVPVLLPEPRLVLQLHEVKGSWSMKGGAASRVRIKVAADLYPWFVFRAITRKKGSWEVETFSKEPGDA